MARKKRGSSANEIYNEHLMGTQYAGKFRTSPEADRQAVMERMYRRVLTELASNRFKWTGMPDSVDVRFMEIVLFHTGLSVFFFDKAYDKFFALRGGGMGPMNMMENPTKFIVTGNQYTVNEVSATESSKKTGIAVPIWSNYLRRPDLDIVMVYAHKLARLDMSIEINSDNARRSKVLVVDERMRLSAENIIRQVDEGSGHISVNAGTMNLEDMIKAIDLGVTPESIEKLHIVRTRLWNECMGLLGIENANQDKKERLVSDEVDANKDQTSMMRYVNLNARRQAIEKIKRAYPDPSKCGGVDFSKLSVDYWTDEERNSGEVMTGLPDMSMLGLDDD
jgi:hypothetical protein